MERVVLTSENSGAFYERELNLAPEPVAAPAKPETAKPGEPAVESVQAVAVEPPDEANDKQIPDPDARQKVNLRFSELTEKRKAAEAEAETAKAEAKAERDARALAERRAAELQAKYEPPKPDELGPKPTREQFSDPATFETALEDYIVEKTTRERDQREAQAKVEQAWTARQTAAKAELPDYETVLEASANLVVSNEVRDAILESDVGPKILYHLAKNPELVSDLAKKSRAGALLMIGRLDAQFAKASAEPVGSKEPVKPVVAASEPSRAPAPIIPLRGVSAPVESPIGPDGVFHGSPAEWRALRKAGKIR